MWFQPMVGRLLLLQYNKLVGNLGVRHCLCTAYKTTTYNGNMRTPSARDLVTYRGVAAYTLSRHGVHIGKFKKNREIKGQVSYCHH